MTLRSRIVAGTALLAAAVVAFATRPIGLAAGAPGPTVMTASGPVAGTSSSGGIDVFEGVPYAAPPVGDRRWRPPAPPVPWTAPLAATDYGASCPQEATPRFVADGSRAQTTDEDCLTLNVWTPHASGKNRPVMVWIHGGGNTSGTASQTFYDGSSFARDGIVFVSFNYRLGLLGFFAHPALRAAAPADPDVANYGLMDQIAALRWVRANASAFGGDPANVTVFGESAGGEDVAVLDTVPAARGLFARAIVESGADLWQPWPLLARAETEDGGLVTALGAPGDATAAQLRALPAATLTRTLFPGERIGPIVDGRLIEAMPQTLLAKRPGVPLLIGTNDGESSLLGDGATLHDVAPFAAPTRLDRIRAAYAPLGVAGDAALANRVFVDGDFAAPARALARAKIRAGVPAYVYRFDYVASVFDGVRGDARHGSEIPFVFETFPDRALSEGDRTIEAQMHDAWVAFAKTGVPSSPALPAWPPFRPEDGRVMVFDAHSSVRDPGTNTVEDRLEAELGPK